MKKSICFAGFGDDELESLKQAMSGISGAWDCTFAPDAEAALKGMEGKTIDAVVANMHMKGMNGAELLHRTNEKYPTALRFVVGDLADQELIINCIGGTHQFISRPYKPKELISVIQRSFALDACLSSDQLRAIAPKLGRLPTLPSTYFEVLKRIESRDASAESVGEVIARDPAATARVLQMVNSAAFALAQKVSDPSHAVMLLGLDTVKSLVLCLQVFNKVERTKQAGFSLEQLWDHSSAVARMARDIVVQQTANAQLANDAFTAGLLHDVGRIVIASNLSKEYAAVVAAAKQKNCSLHEEELAQLGVTHSQVGAYLLGLWGMPAALVEAAALHHSPSQSTTAEFSLLTAVHAADVFAHENDSPENGLPLPKLDMAYFETLGIAHKPAVWHKVITGAASTGDTERVTKAGAQAGAQRADARASAKPAAAKQGGAARADGKPGSKQTLAPAAASSRNSFAKFLVPAGAAAAIVIGLLIWNGSGGSNSLPVRAKTDDQTASTGAKPVIVAAAQTPSDASGNTKASGTKSTQSSSATAAAPQTASKPAAPAAPAVGFDAVKVQGIFYSDNHRSVIINGKLLGQGDYVVGVQVVSIAQQSVVLAYNGQEKTFKVK